jgi:hypothetical protein
MTQNVLTVTAANPTPPTNLIYVGNTPTLDYLQPYADDGITAAIPSATVGGASNGHTTNELAGSTWPVAIAFTTSASATNTAPASSGSVINGGQGISNTHEARGTETVSALGAGTPGIANPSALGQLRTLGVGPALTAASIAAGPNASHASSMSPTTPAQPTTTAAAPNNIASGAGVVPLLTVTGTNFNRSSVVYVNGVAQITNLVSATSVTVANAPKRSTAGTYTVSVLNGTGGIMSTPATWTFT